LPTSSNDCGLATAKRPDTDPSNPSLRSYLGTETKSRHAGRSRKLVGVIATRNLARVGALLSRSQLVWSRAGEYFGTPAILAETIPAARATKAFAEMKQNWPTFWPTALSRGPKLKNGCCSKPRRKPFLARAAPEGEKTPSPNGPQMVPVAAPPRLFFQSLIRRVGLTSYDAKRIRPSDLRLRLI
jgi:hypothetical protein